MWIPPGTWSAGPHGVHQTGRMVFMGSGPRPKEDKTEASVAGMTVLELGKLLSDFERKFGVPAKAPFGISGAPIIRVGQPHGERNFDVLLIDAKGDRLLVMKAIRKVAGVGLKESKELVDSPPSMVLHGVTYEEAAKAIAALDSVGALATIRPARDADAMESEAALLTAQFPWIEADACEAAARLLSLHFASIRGRQAIDITQLAEKAKLLRQLVAGPAET